MAGRAVICSRVGGMPEVVLDEQCGILYPPADERALAAAIDRLAGDWDLAARFGARSREHAMQHYTLRRHVDHLMTIYDQCIADFASAHGTRPVAANTLRSAATIPEDS